MLGIDVGAPPLPAQETRLEFMRRYAEDSGKRLAALREKDEPWWEELTTFFDVRRSRAWVMTRRMTHTSHHRGQQMAMLRMLGRDLHSNYGPTADTGGLMQNHAPTIYAYTGLQPLLDGESRGGAKSPLPPPGSVALTERPDARRPDRSGSACPQLLGRPPPMSRSTELPRLIIEADALGAKAGKGEAK